MDKLKKLREQGDVKVKKIKGETMVELLIKGQHDIYIARYVGYGDNLDEAIDDLMRDYKSVED